MILDKIKELTDAIINVDERIGFRRFVKYILLGLGIVMIFNYKTILRDVVEIVIEIERDIHSDKMKLRDELLAELGPILADFRSNVKADRILYFEYHNSKENLVGIPFKYVELVQQNSGYGVRSASENRYSGINAGAISDLYEDIKLGKIVYCSGPYDDLFNSRYPGVFDMFYSRDGGRRFVFISIPGIDTPIGMIVLEWMTESSMEFDKIEISEAATHNYIPRINALILSKRKQ